MIIVVGHKNPDTDTIVSAIVWAEFLNLTGKKAKAGRGGELNFETKYILSRFKGKAPALVNDLTGKEVFLVDHGELKQSPDGIEKAKIVGILDHHRLAGIIINEPTYYRSEPIGSTSTLIAKIFNEAGKKLNKKQASLLLSGIISDTFKFTSPTTTEEDKKIGKQLQKISGVDINELTEKIFEVKSSLKGLSIENILKKDCKEFEFGKTKLSIGIYETASVRVFDAMKNKVGSALKALKEKQRADLAYFVVVDILKQEGFIYLIGEKEKEIAQKAFKGKIENNIMHVLGLVSRKKQMVPVLAKLLEI